jgi:uncharacterized protein (DUF302 family)
MGLSAGDLPVADFRPALTRDDLFRTDQGQGGVAVSLYRPHDSTGISYCPSVSIRRNDQGDASSGIFMTYYFNTTLRTAFEDAVARTVLALKAEGFGIISDIDVQKTLHEKIGVAFRPYRILGACNPKLAHEALQLEDKIGTMLPCNVVVQALADGNVEIAAIDPVASMQAVDNLRLKEAAAEVGQRLKRAIANIVG